MDFASGYRGQNWAEFYFKLWDTKCHIVRRVTTIRILDRARLSYSNTFDIDWGKLTYPKQQASRRQHLVLPEKYSQDIREEEEARNCVYIPLIRLKRQHFLDVDCLDSEGKAIHLARKKVNEAISAHIFVGAALATSLSMSKFNLAHQTELYDRVLSHIRGTRADIISHDEGSVPQENFASYLSSFGFGVDISRLTSLAREMNDSYIQTVLVHPPVTDISIIKIRFTTNSDIFRFPKAKSQETYIRSSQPVELRPELNPNQITTAKELAGSDINEQVVGIYSGKYNLPKNTVLQKFESLLRALGIMAHHLYISEPAIGLGYAPLHTRVIAPKGMLLEDVTVERPEETGMYKSFQSDFLKIRIHHERCAIMDSGADTGIYCINIKVNPKRGSLIWPLMGISFTLLALTILALMLGPDRLVRHDAALAGALFIFPSLALIFLSRENEHEVLGKTTLPLHVLGALSALSGGVSGALVSSLPSTIKPNVNNFHVSITFWVLLGSSLLAFAAFLLSSFQFCRIGRMRSIVKRSRQEETHEEQQRVLNIKYLWFRLEIVIIALFSVAVLGIVCRSSWPYVKSLWLIGM